ncbi:16S rRNA (guanine(966)-N(2))-methyltransferase RsmD [Hutsoniella sourekii]|uniref:16S rRNA (guanine(966)-N(2))-methyltransferase RsmD n=1 Tax=Hutsoniella sourekii TaxID=87650 RepID=UPI000487275B|nr:16S rRNA (guanine(966)-N(2))-methyltransferase RsmD [Hutsoniella sourekii]
MRVVCGKYGSRPLKAVPGKNTRPTTDKIKEAIFNLLGQNLQGKLFLDMYAGSGAIAIEAVSRGFDHAVLCERYRPAQATIQANLEMTRELERFTLLKGDSYKSLLKWQVANPDQCFDAVFLDPPYAKETIAKDIAWLEEQGLLASGCRIICELDKAIDLPASIDKFQLYKSKLYGITKINIYQEEE